MAYVERGHREETVPARLFEFTKDNPGPGAFSDQVGMLPLLLRSLASLGCPTLGDMQYLDRRKITLVEFQNGAPTVYLTRWKR